MSWRVVIAASVALVLGGCVGTLDVEQRSFAIERTREVRRGMTKEQIAAVVGPPHYMFKEDRPETPELWTYVDEPSGPASRRTLRVFFDPAGRVAVLEMKRYRPRR